eukprot:jgi/Mesvir1/27787/Mv07468-RA.2
MHMRRSIPIDFVWHDGRCFLFSEGGIKFVHLLRNPHASATMFDSTKDSRNPVSLQIQGPTQLLNYHERLYGEVMALWPGNKRRGAGATSTDDKNNTINSSTDKGMYADAAADAIAVGAAQGDSGTDRVARIAAAAGAAAGAGDAATTLVGDDAKGPPVTGDLADEERLEDKDQVWRSIRITHDDEEDESAAALRRPLLAPSPPVIGRAAQDQGTPGRWGQWTPGGDVSPGWQLPGRVGMTSPKATGGGVSPPPGYVEQATGTIKVTGENAFVEGRAERAATDDQRGMSSPVASPDGRSGPAGSTSPGPSSGSSTSSSAGDVKEAGSSAGGLHISHAPPHLEGVRDEAGPVPVPAYTGHIQEDAVPLLGPDRVPSHPVITAVSGNDAMVEGVVAGRAGGDDVNINGMAGPGGEVRRGVLGGMDNYDGELGSSSELGTSLVSDRFLIGLHIDPFTGTDMGVGSGRGVNEYQDLAASDVAGDVEVGPWKSFQAAPGARALEGPAVGEFMQSGLAGQAAGLVPPHGAVFMAEAGVEEDPHDAEAGLEPLMHVEETHVIMLTPSHIELRDASFIADGYDVRQFVQLAPRPGDAEEVPSACDSPSQMDD